MSDLVSSRSFVKRQSLLRVWIRAIGFSVQLMLAAWLILIAVQGYLARARLRAAFADLDRNDPGWRFADVEAARAVVPDAENSALCVIAANKLLPAPPKQWIEEDFDAELQHLPPEKRISPAQLTHLRRCLDEAKPALDQLKNLSELPRGRIPIVFERDPMKTVLNDHQGCRKIFHLLNRNGMAYAEEGQPHLAVKSCRGALNAARAVGDEPLAIVQLIRVAGVVSTCRNIERLLAQTEPASADLARLQEELEKEDAFPRWPLTWRGERALANANLEALEAGVTRLSEVVDERPNWWETVFAIRIEDNIRAIHPQLFVYAAKMKAAADLPAGQRGPAMAQVGREIRRTGPNLAAMWATVYPPVVDAFLRCHAALRCQIACLAAERYRRSHGGWPKSLEQLTPDFLPAVPTDPFKDAPLCYRSFPDGIVVYSVSSDGVDNGGAINWDAPNLPGTDIGFRLWDIDKRRQHP